MSNPTPLSPDASHSRRPSELWRRFVQTLNAYRNRPFLPARWFLFSALAFVVVAFLIYGQSGPDDAYITYWPARALAEHGRIWNYNGVRVEQSSSLSLVVVLAILYRLTPFSMPVVAFLPASDSASPRSGWQRGSPDGSTCGPPPRSSR